MMRLLFGSLLFCFSWLAQAADSSLSFTPPAGDYSVIFLGDLFGVVDGVLHGTGSQIMGNMFGVFNAAVLALGGIIITYTLMVSTMNTAHEGQMLGQKWSSIWIPVRSTMGLALLIPKASGYCLMQVFVMWIVLQGVGAADKIWNAALDYLNRGGVIVQAATDTSQTMAAEKTTALASGAQDLLAAQTCMIGVEQLLREKREDYLKQKQKNVGDCVKPTADLKDFCQTPVPDFLTSVNPVAERAKSMENYQAALQSDRTVQPPTSFAVKMPNLSNAPYNQLNGICGTLTWDTFSADNQKSINDMVSGSNAQTALMSMTIAVQQMYQDLGMLARVMVNNAPLLPSKDLNASPFSDVANDPYGLPLTSEGSACTSTDGCTFWGLLPGVTGSPLFTGAELQNAISDFEAIILPTLQLISEAKNKAAAQASTGFIQKAEAQGWILAGSYFFDLVSLNKAHSNSWDELQKQLNAQLGISKSLVQVSGSINTNLNTSFNAQGQDCSVTSNPYSAFCTWMGNDSDPKNKLISLINAKIKKEALPPDPPNAVTGTNSSTVYGYTQNATLLQLPGQPGQTLPTQINEIKNPWSLQSVIPTKTFGGLFGPLFDILYNGILVALVNGFVAAIEPLLYTLYILMLWGPLKASLAIFEHGVSLLGQTDVNPIVNLAQMGNFFINFAMNTWIAILGGSVTLASVPMEGIVVVMVLIALVFPITLAWLSMMTAIGFFVAYYVPFVPFLLFTFGSIAWFMVVIEAMVAAPIVALGVSHPEGHDAFGKGEQAIMILMNVFLRPSMMVIGYIAGIALSYVGVWVLNAGFNNAVSFQKDDLYSSWTLMFSTFFIILIYIMAYVAIVQQSFSLISYLPDKILRWIGGQPESIGQEASRWGDEVKSKTQEGAKGTMEGQSAGARQMAGHLGKAVEKWAESKGGGVSAGAGEDGGKGKKDKSSGESTPSSSLDDDG